MGHAPLGYPPSGSWIHPAQVSTWHLFRPLSCTLLTSSSPQCIWNFVSLKTLSFPGSHVPSLQKLTLRLGLGVPILSTIAHLIPSLTASALPLH